MNNRSTSRSRALVPVVNYALCMACNICITACPFSCLEAVRTDIDAYRKAYPGLVRADLCTGCGLCAKACPLEAVTLVPREGQQISNPVSGSIGRDG